MGALKSFAERNPGKKKLSEEENLGKRSCVDLLSMPISARKKLGKNEGRTVGGILSIFCNNAGWFAVREYVILRILTRMGRLGHCGVVSMVNARCITIL